MCGGVLHILSVHDARIEGLLSQITDLNEQASMDTKEDFKQRSDELHRQITKDRDRLRKLKMVKMYRTKNDLSELQVLIDKWRTACQMAIGDIYDITPDPRPSLTELISEWKVDCDIIKYDHEAECFQ